MPKSILLALVLALGLWALLPLRQGHAQQAPDIQGKVVNGTADAPTPSGLTVRLVAQVGQTLLDDRSSATDSGGQFIFSDVKVEPNAVYFVTAEYQAVEYTVRVDPLQPDATWRLMVYESTSEAENIRVAENTLFIPRADERQRNLLALELVRVQNLGDRTFVADLSRPREMGFLRFSLPPNAADLDVQSTLRGGSVVPVDRGFAITTPLPPGNHEMLFSYTIPYSGGTLSYERTFPFGAGAFELLMGDAGGRVQSPRLEVGSSVVIDEKQYTRLTGKNLAPGARVELTFTSLPKPSLLRRILAPFQSGMVATVGVPVLAGVVLSLLIGLALLRMRDRRRAGGDVPTIDRTRDEAARAELLAAVVGLDDRFARGAIPEGEYRAQREQMMERLRKTGRSNEASLPPVQPDTKAE